jgi:hypothetical protein
MSNVNLLSRKYDIAEYFFDDEATQYLDYVDEAIDEVFSVDLKTANALKKYRDGEKFYLSTGIGEEITAGFGTLDEYGYFEFPLPANFVKKFLI